MAAGGARKPLILAVVGDAGVEQRLVADLVRRFGGDYEVVGETSAEGGLETVAESSEVAVVIASQRLAGVTGIEFLGRAHAVAPAARRALLIAYGDPDRNDVVIEAMTFARIDQWLWQPWDPAEELLYPCVGALLTAWAIVVRGPSLTAKMSDYLVREIERASNIAVRTQTEIVDAAGGGRLERLTLRHTASATQEVVDTAGLFVLIGALPHTDWLPTTVMRDEDGYISTGRDLIDSEGNAPTHWPLRRAPLLYETSMPGVFAAGDVRHRSTKRVASAVGEGTVTVQQVHEHLAEISPTASQDRARPRGDARV